MWFRFPEHFAAQVSARADSFVVALLLVAMQNREDIEVQGAVSARLLAGLNHYQSLFARWFPERFRVIQVRASQIVESQPALSSGVACAFSGGVDSFYTLLKLREQGELTHSLFMAGFDMPLHLEASTRELTQSYEELMRDWGIEFVSGSTNVRAFVDSVDWTNAHGPALLASALFFQNVWSNFYVPSSYAEGAYPAWGTHPELDSLLSTESLQFIHHGAELNRVGKLRAITQCPESYSRLRVCWIQDIGLRNCGCCEKCVRTMTALSILGYRKQYSTFAPGPSLGTQIRALTQRTHQGRVFSRELALEALRRGKLGIACDLGYSLARRKVTRALSLR